jgi:hypothetical protein
VGSVVALLTEVTQDKEPAAVDGVLLCPNLFDNAKLASRVEEVIEFRIARGLPTVVYIPPLAEKKPRFQRLIARLMETCHHGGRDPLPKAMTEAEKLAAEEAWMERQEAEVAA